MEGEGQLEDVPSMSGCFRYSLDLLLDEVKAAHDLGIGALAQPVLRAIALFPLMPHHQKDNAGTKSYNADGLIPRAVRAIQQAVPQMPAITDVALDS
jgi:porphobilinogen synthase